VTPYLCLSLPHSFPLSLTPSLSLSIPPSSQFNPTSFLSDAPQGDNSKTEMDPALHHAAQQHAQQPIVWRESSQQGNKFVLPDYYSVIRTLGAGAYGVVCHAIDTDLYQILLRTNPSCC
jgi:hypothetical protein